MSSSAAAFTRLLEVLDRMEIPYLVGGSVASSAHGVPRTTLDIDLVVDLKPDRIEAFAPDLAQEFYADAGMIRESFARGRAANLIHLETAWKFDCSRFAKTPTAGRRLAGDLSVKCGPTEKKQSNAPLLPLRTRSCGRWSRIAQAERPQNGSGRIFAAFARPRADNSIVGNGTENRRSAGALGGRL